MSSVVLNRQRNVALAVRRDRHRCCVLLIQMASGPLGLTRISDKEFAADWRVVPYPFSKALERFLEHAKEHSATAEARAVLERLTRTTDACTEDLFG